MTSDFSIQAVKSVAWEISNYLELNQKYRSTRKNPDLKMHLKSLRNQAFRSTQIACDAMTKHLSMVSSAREFSQIEAQALELANRWSARNEAFAALSNPYSTASHETTLALNKSEKSLRKQLALIVSLLSQEEK